MGEERREKRIKINGKTKVHGMSGLAILGGGRKCTFYRGTSRMRRCIRPAHTYFLARSPHVLSTATSHVLDRLLFQPGKRARSALLVLPLSSNRRETVPKRNSFAKEKAMSTPHECFFFFFFFFFERERY